MKKLLLPIVVLFVLFSIQSLANSCNAQVCTCPNGGWVTFGQYCTTQTVEIEKKYYGAIAVEVETGKWSNAYNYPSNSSAKEKVYEKKILAIIILLQKKTLLQQTHQ